jgi:HPt (histidine-containing phosphotransfer) domain-containing protein
MELDNIEKEIAAKAKDWIDDYGEDFLVELIDVYLDDTPVRLAQLRQALDGGDAETMTREAHTVKSSSANVGAMTLSALAQQVEFASRNGRTDSLAAEVGRMAAIFARVKATLEALRHAPGKFIGEER